MEKVHRLMTPAEYVRFKVDEDRAAGFEGAGSFYSITEWEANHLAIVREAVAQHRDIHFESFFAYRKLIPGLSHYSLNGDVAVYDSGKTWTPPTPAKRHWDILEALERQARKAAPEGGRG